MSSASLFNPTSMAANSCLTSQRTLFTTKASYPFLSLPSKPIKLIHLSSSSSPFHLKKKLSSSLIPFVAQTSDWAPQENRLEEDESEGEVTEAGLFDWEGEGEVEGKGEGEGEGEGDVEGSYEESPEEAESAEEGEVEGSYEPPPEEAKLFVGNLPYDMDSEKLAHLFDQAGEVQISEVIYNKDTDQSRGFAFVTMRSVEEAEKAIEMFNRYDVNGRLLTVNKAAPRGSRPERPARVFDSSLRIYVGNLPWSVDNSRLEQVFSEHGKVVDARVVFDRETGRSRGFGFVTMANQAELDDAIAALDGQTVDGRAIRVNVAEERPRRF